MEWKGVCYACEDRVPASGHMVSSFYTNVSSFETDSNVPGRK